MKLKSMITLVTSELTLLPRGERRSAQNLFRAAYWAARMNSLGRRPQISPTPGAALTFALWCVRGSDPALADFTPRFISP